MNPSELPAILGGQKTIEAPAPHFVWPPITDETRQAVLAQLDRTISIYDKSDIFERFEGKFARYHDRKHSLLHNSGTSAILGMYFGLDLKPGDEVICPTYTFYASVTPMLITGAKPVFCDCKEDGNIDPREIEAAITDKTKAIAVTHMWGIPCDMDDIVAITRKHNLRLVEDCSHAHGAELGGKKVGTFGDAAAWSFQGQKTVTGGEGGIILTDDQELHTRALLLGHYNKRCKQEIDKSHPFYEYFLTGFGLKLRAHPLAIAIADQQFDHLEEYLHQRGEFADYMIDELKKFDCLSMPNTQDRKPSWYAFVMQYHSERAHGLPMQEFYKAILAEGLAEADRPGSTKHIHDLLLFTHPEGAFPQLYQANSNIGQDREFPRAKMYTEQALKFPVWSSKEDWPMVELYVAGMKKILDNTRALAAEALS